MEGWHLNFVVDQWMVVSWYLEVVSKSMRPRVFVKQPQAKVSRLISFPNVSL